MRKPSHLTQRLPGIAAVLVVVACFSLGPWAWMASHAPWPGVSGCQMVRSNAARIKCLAGVIRGRAHDRDLVSVMAELDRKHRSPRSQLDCHATAHVVARDLARRSTATVTGIVRALDRDLPGQCTTGLMHGMLEIAVSADASNETRAAAMQTCARLEYSGECFHGVGHGLARIAGTSAAAFSRCAGHR